MRKATRGWIAGAIIALVGLALVITLIPGALPQRPDLIAEGDGVRITVAEYDRELERRLARARNQGQPATRAQVVEAGLHRALRDDMVNERSLDRLARRLGLYVSDAVVGEEIRKLEAFRNQITGAFDKDTYARLLAENGFTTQEFENNVRNEIARQQLVAAVTAPVLAPQSYTNFLISFETERRTIDVAEITLARIGEPPTPTEAQIEDAYKASSAAFATPEYRALTVVIADSQAFAAKVEVPEDDIRKQYEFAKDRYSTPETRTVVQVTAPNADAARDAARRLAANEDPNAVAAAVGGTVATFDKVTRDKIPDPKVAAAVFAAAKAGAATPAIDGDLAWAAARVTEIVPAKSRTFEEAAPEIRAEMQREEADSLAAAAVERFEDFVAEGRTIEDAAKEAGLEARSVPQIDAQGRGADRAPITWLADDDEFLRAVFATAEGEKTDFTALKNGQFASARVERLIPPGVRPLAEVREVVVSQWRSNWLREQFTKIADQVKASVAAGQTFEQAARQANLPVRQSGVEIDRRSVSQGPAAALGQAVFGAGAGDIVTTPNPSGEPSLFVIRVAAISRPDPKTVDPALAAQAREAAAQQLQQDFAQTLVDAARAAAKVKVNERALNQLLGTDETAGGPAGSS